MFELNLIPFYDEPGDTGGGSGEDLSESDQDLQDLEEGTPPKDEEGEGDEDADDSEEKDDSEGEEDEDDSEEGEGESDEDSEDEEEEDEEKGKEGKKEDEEDELDESGRPTVKALKKAYPDLFKRFPGLRQAFFEHPKFLEVFADPESAQEAAAKANEYDALESSIVGKGDSELLIKTLGENNPAALKKVVESFAETVRAHDKDLYRTLATPIIEEVVYHAAAHANKLGVGKDQPGRNLMLAARHIANFVFANGGEIPDISKRASGEKKEPSDAERQLNEERAAYRQEKYEGAMTEVEGKLTTELNGILGNKLESLTPFERKAVIKDARREIDQALLADKAFQRTLGALWRQAADSGYSDASKQRIRRAWLDRARTIAPGVRNRLRQEALDARTPRKGDSDEERSSKSGKKRQFPSQGGRGSGKSSKGYADPSKIDWKKTSDLDILNS